MHIDYYTAGIEAKSTHVLGVLESSFDLSDVRPSTPRNGYERAHQIVRGDEVLATVMYGGTSVGTRVWTSATGDNAQAFSEAVREHFPVHSMLRGDVAIDYCEEGAWDVLAKHSIATADLHGLKVEHRGDYHRAKQGRTLYVGSRTSAAYMRTYEKGKQLGTDPNHVRVELEVKPQSASARLAYASATPSQMLMATKWTQYYYSVIERISDIRPAPAGNIRKKSNDERAIEFMVKQYRNVLLRLMEQEGGDIEAWGIHLAKKLYEES